MNRVIANSVLTHTAQSIETLTYSAARCFFFRIIIHQTPDYCLCPIYSMWTCEHQRWSMHSAFCCG